MNKMMSLYCEKVVAKMICVRSDTWRIGDMTRATFILILLCLKRNLSYLANIVNLCLKVHKTKSTETAKADKNGKNMLYVCKCLGIGSTESMDLKDIILCTDFDLCHACNGDILSILK